ncbi:hypothetical protein ACJMK2_033477 [Sinanodonta woodiana]|uniref:Uncharacterized protein n=1 Tax=Sinanodonta woodiana TaxID=1069815 RepID=A0ABD3WS72_SINWO
MKLLQPLHTGDVVRVKPSDKHVTWSKAYVEGKVDICFYKIRTEDGSQTPARLVPSEICKTEKELHVPKRIENTNSDAKISSRTKSRPKMSGHQAVNTNGGSPDNSYACDEEVLRNMYLKDYIT